MRLTPESCEFIEEHLQAMGREFASLSLEHSGIERFDRAIARISHCAHAIRSEIAYSTIHVSETKPKPQQVTLADLGL